MIEKGKVQNLIVVFSILGLVVCIIPLLAISHYNFPATDDYTYGEVVKGFSLGEYGLLGAVSSAISHTVSIWHTWQGRYFDVFLFFLNFGVEYPGLYCITTYLTLISFILSSFALWMVFLRKILNADAKTSITVISVVLIPILLFVVSPGEGFFWFSGGISYTLAYSLSQFLGAVLLGMIGSKHKLFLCVLGFALSFMVAGFNYGTVLVTLECLVLLTLFSLKTSYRYYYISISVFYFCCFLLSALAPGNKTRFDISEQMGPVESIIKSYSFSGVFIRQWIHIPVLICIIYAVIMLIPFVVKKVETGFKYSWPGIFSFITISVYSSLLTPTLYSTSSSGPLRQLNLQYFMMYALIISNMLYWIGWIATKIKNKHVFENLKTEYAYKPDVIILFVVFFGLSMIHWGIWNTWPTSAFRSIRSGEAARYRYEQYERLEVLRDVSITDPVFEPFTSKPRIFFSEEITADPDHFSNRSCAWYYGKDSVRVSE